MTERCLDEPGDDQQRDDRDARATRMSSSVRPVRFGAAADLGEPFATPCRGQREAEDEDERADEPPRSWVKGRRAAGGVQPDGRPAEIRQRTPRPDSLPVTMIAEDDMSRIHTRSSTSRTRIPGYGPKNNNAVERVTVRLGREQRG